MIRQIIQEYIAELRKEGINVQAVHLFGSRAKGKPRHEYSDIDLCIISPQFGKDWQKEMTNLLFLASRLNTPVPIEPIPFAPGDLEDEDSGLAEEIRKYGKKVEA